MRKSIITPMTSKEYNVAHSMRLHARSNFEITEVLLQKNPEEFWANKKNSKDDIQLRPGYTKNPVFQAKYRQVRNTFGLQPRRAYMHNRSWAKKLPFTSEASDV